MKIGSDLLKSFSLTYDDGLACHTKPDQDIVKPSRDILVLSTEAAIPFIVDSKSNAFQQAAAMILWQKYFFEAKFTP